MSEVVLTVEDLVTELLTVPSSRPYRASKQVQLAEKTIWHPLLPTGSLLSHASNKLYKIYYFKTLKNK